MTKIILNICCKNRTWNSLTGHDPLLMTLSNESSSGIPLEIVELPEREVGVDAVLVDVVVSDVILSACGETGT